MEQGLFIGYSCAGYGCREVTGAEISMATNGIYMCVSIGYQMGGIC